MTVLRAGSSSDVGRQRSVNQDRVLVARDLFAVADGMGGHQGGEVASQMTVDVLARGLPEPTADTLVEMVRQANTEVFERSREETDLTGMGTTCVAIALVSSDENTPDEERLAIAHVGDSRVYRLQDGELHQITDDHSLVADLVRDGRITEEEAETHPRRNIVTRAVGIDSEVVIDLIEVLPFTGDRYVLCSDGLFNEVSDDQIASVMRRLDDPDDAAGELVRLANEGGGRDNISVVIVDVVDDDGRAEAASEALAGTGRDGLESHDDPAGFSSAIAADDADDPDDPDGGDDGQADRTPSSAAGSEEEPDDEARPRRVTWRSVLMLVVIVGVFAVAFAAVGWYARGSYFVAFDDDRVAIYQGRPGDFLWFDATLHSHASLTRDDLRPVAVTSVDKQPEFGSIDAAQTFVLNLQTRDGTGAAETGPPGTFDSTTTTTTTRPATTSSTTTTRPRATTSTTAAN